jgi:alpha-beta hydrolase superfamily lysophospholipase
VTSVRRAGLAAALAAPFALAWRFALVYRVRAGFPHPRTPSATPLALGMAFEEVTVPSRGADLAGWFMPGQGGSPGPGVALVHGWESGRDRTLPLAHVLHEVGFHVLSIDVRGHGANAAERLPVTGGEFGADAGAAFDQLLARPEVTVGAIHGHSMGGIGAILAAAADPRVSALAATSAPADPYRLTRQTFRLARLPIPDPIAYPLAWWTTRVFLQPRGHTVADVSASEAIGRYRGPVLLLHGDADDVVPVGHVARLEAAARRGRAGRSDAAPVTSVVIEGGRHSWLYEDPSYRASLARFLATALGGPLEPDEAARVAAGVPATRMPDPETPFTAVQAEPGGLRSLAGVATPGATATPNAAGEGLLDEEPPGPPPGFDLLHLPASPNEPSGA